MYPLYPSYVSCHCLQLCTMLVFTKVSIIGLNCHCYSFTHCLYSLSRLRNHCTIYVVVVCVIKPVTHIVKNAFSRVIVTTPYHSSTLRVRITEPHVMSHNYICMQHIMIGSGLVYIAGSCYFTIFHSRRLLQPSSCHRSKVNSSNQPSLLLWREMLATTMSLSDWSSSPLSVDLSLAKGAPR